MNISYATLSQTGKRTNNEDVYRVMDLRDRDRWMGIVCDGMGGHAMGEVASETVAGVIFDFWKLHADEPDTEEKLREACRQAAEALNERSDFFKQVEMGTTMVMASLENDTLTIAHTGDSRCYFQRPGEGVLYQTKDHTELSFGWEIVSKCFFSYRPEAALPDRAQFKVKSRDRLLLCSDGLYKSMAPDILRERMMDDKTPAEILDVFDFLSDKFGDDNYTAILVQMD